MKKFIFGVICSFMIGIGMVSCCGNRGGDDTTGTCDTGKSDSAYKCSTVTDTTVVDTNVKD